MIYSRSFNGFLLLESAVSLSLLCIVMLSILPLIVQLKEQTVKRQREVEVARLCYEGSQELREGCDRIERERNSKGVNYQLISYIANKTGVYIEVNSPITYEKWRLYEK